MPTLFDTTTINGLELKNRFVRSATWEGMALPDGSPSAKLTDLMAGLAKGEVGLIISSHAYVSRQGQATPLQLGIHQDNMIEPLREMTAAVHKHSGAIIAQLAHAGKFTHESMTGIPPLALSVKDASKTKNYQEATLDDLQRLPFDFAAAAGRAQEAGFDGVQLHAAHGYLLSQSLSPAFNQRNDGFGGSLEHRARLLLETVSSVRKRIGKKIPLLVKLNSADYLENGLCLDESLIVAQWLQEAGVDAIEVSGGTIASGEMSPVRIKINTEAKEAYFRDAAKRFKAQLKIPVILVGGVRTMTLAERLLNDGVADYFSMARPFVREPELIKRWHEGDLRKAHCISDNLCHGAAMAGEGLHCVLDRKKDFISSRLIETASGKDR